METKTLTKEQIELLNKPLPQEALKPHPTKKFLTTINAIYVTERLNEVFGVGKWKTKVEHVETVGKMVVTKTTFEVPEYDIYYECYGGNDNADMGDAYKGSTTDAITKIGSYLGIGAHVWKNNPYPKEEHNANGSQRSERDMVIAQLETCESEAQLKQLSNNFFNKYKGDAEVVEAFKNAKKGLGL